MNSYEYLSYFTLMQLCHVGLFGVSSADDRDAQSNSYHDIQCRPLYVTGYLMLSIAVSGDCDTVSLVSLLLFLDLFINHIQNHNFWVILLKIIMEF